MQDNRRGNLWVWVGIVVVVVIVILFFVWKPGSNPAPTGVGTTAPTPNYAPQGQLASGFPQNIIADNNAVISSSFSLEYTTSTNQYSASWNSSSSLSAETSKYQTYLTANGWKVTPNPVRETNIRTLSAMNNTALVLVTIVSQGTGSQVSVSYVQK